MPRPQITRRRFLLRSPAGLISSALVVLLAASAAPAADAPDQPHRGEPERAASRPDPWTGKARDEVLAMLGEPTRRRQRGRDGATWTYRLFRVEDPDGVPVGAMLIDLPRIGLVANPEPRWPDDDPVIVPIEVDRAGRGLSSEGEAASMSWSRDAKTGEVTKTPRPGRTKALGRKLKLRLEIDSEGRVREWSITPPPRPGSDEPADR